MKKFLLLFTLFCASIGLGLAQDAPSGTIKGAENEVVEVTLSLNAPENFTPCAFQCDVVLPDGVTPVEDPELSVNTHNIASNLLAGNKYRILCYSMTNADLPADATITFKVKCNQEVNASYTIEGIELADKNSVANTDTDVIKPAEDKILGDVNGDGSVDVGDLNLVISNILNGNYNPESDINNDRSIDVGDLNLVIKEILK